eukprot:GHVH01007673.1.p3 GENE.GHVH01007673.1~~GHVH01007673.1.p3  ORF type:complete len:105 (-),score=15.35 GHVH01007673.1:156-470(-)
MEAARRLFAQRDHEVIQVPGKKTDTSDCRASIKTPTRTHVVDPDTNSVVGLPVRLSICPTASDLELRTVAPLLCRLRKPPRLQPEESSLSVGKLPSDEVWTTLY